MRLIAVAVLAVVALAGCGGGSPGSEGAQGARPAGTDVTIHVPADAPTISDAVALAHPGDLVLVAPGTYHEAVKITTARVTLRGESRAGVIIDGQLQRPNGVVVAAPGVAVENMTVENNTQNGVLVTGLASETAGSSGNSGGYGSGDAPVEFLKSFLVSYVTATRNGLYGIYAFSAQDGVIEHSYVSGGADSGIYVGQCDPCNVVVRDNVAELNAVGFEGTNSSGNMYVVGNRLVGNRVGLTMDSGHQEKLLPQKNAVVAGNLIAANQQPATPEQAEGGWGIGVGVDGGNDNQIVGNRIENNASAGLVITASADIPPDGNQILDNTFDGNGVDVGWTFPSVTKGSGNCLKGNTLRTTMPADLATVAACPASGPSPSATLPSHAPPAGIPFTDVAAPPAQPEFPDATSAGPTTVSATPTLPDVSTITVPSSSLLAANARIAAQ